MPEDGKIAQDGVFALDEVVNREACEEGGEETEDGKEPRSWGAAVISYRLIVNWVQGFGCAERASCRAASGESTGSRIDW